MKSNDYYRNPVVQSEMLPVDVVFHPSWWNKHAGITFDEDFFYHPLKRVESETRMEKILYDKFGQYGPGEDRDKELPVIGAVHNAAGFIISEMLGCRVEYIEDGAPRVIPSNQEKLSIDLPDAFDSQVFKKLLSLCDALKGKYGYLQGDVNWGGVLNTALDLYGEQLFLKFLETPEEVQKYFKDISAVIEKFVLFLSQKTGSTSISVNRNVRHIKRPVFLHSECSLVMISTDQYDQMLLPIDNEWSRKYRPFGIHYCGEDPHRYAQSFKKIDNLDFLDVGWGGDIRELRNNLPHTFLNIRLSPVEIKRQSKEQITQIVRNLVKESGNPYLTGVCCINMDSEIEDEKIAAIFNTVEELRQEYQAGFDLFQ